MKLTKLLSAFLTALILTANAFSIDTLTAKYFPLHVGNMWVYDKMMSPPYPNSRIRCTITQEGVINSHNYYFMQAGPFLYDAVWIRIDSVTNNIFMQPQGTPGCPYNINEVLIDSLSAGKYDSAFTCNGFLGNRFCADTGTYTIFNNQTTKKIFAGTALFASSRYYARNFGIYSAIYGENVSTGYTLKGCVINGTVYGDTTLTGLIPVSTIIPEKYTLYQNYPNPFNPTTKIKFDVQARGETNLVIYDALGRQVENLVHEELKSGTYEVKWDASDFPSGIYFYRLEINAILPDRSGHSSQEGTYVNTRKMVLIK